MIRCDCPSPNAAQQGREVVPDPRFGELPPLLVPVRLDVGAEPCLGSLLDRSLVIWCTAREFELEELSLRLLEVSPERVPPILPSAPVPGDLHPGARV